MKYYFLYKNVCSDRKIYIKFTVNISVLHKFKSLKIHSYMRETREIDLIYTLWRLFFSAYTVHHLLVEREAIYKKRNLVLVSYFQMWAPLITFPYIMYCKFLILASAKINTYKLQLHHVRYLTSNFFFSYPSVLVPP